MPDGSNIDWLDFSTLSISAPAPQAPLDWLDTFEEISARNHTGRPVRYLFDLSLSGIDLSADDAIELASFFVDLTPSKTAIALVSSDIENPSLGELIFRNALRGGGFQVCVFSDVATAQTWLSLFVSSCERKGLECGPSCEFALTTACPVTDSGPRTS